MELGLPGWNWQQHLPGCLGCEAGETSVQVDRASGLGNRETLVVSSGGAGEQRRLLTWEMRALFTAVETCVPKMKTGLFVQCLEVI